MSTHSDDLPTDISSSLSSPFGNSFNRKRTTTASSQVERLDEADKQILEWAGKLEMESVDLREKSSQLMQVLRTNSDDLSALVKKLNGVLIKQGNLNDFRSSITELGTRLEEVFSAMKKQASESSKSPPVCSGMTGYEKDLKKLEINILEALDQKHHRHTESIEETRSLLFSVSRQMQDTHQVMASMSTDITSLSKRQTALENHLRECEEVLKRGTDDLANVSEAEDGPTLLNDGPITRSMSKRRTKSIPVKKITKPRDIAITRTIIPWEEVEMYYSSEL